MKLQSWWCWKKYAKMQHYFPHSGLPCCTFFRKLPSSWCWALAVVDIYAASYRFRDIRGQVAKMYVRNFGYCPQKGRRHVGIWCTIMHNFITIGCTVADICPRTDCRFSVTHRVTSSLENLEMLGNLTAVREMSGILLKIREVAGKKSCQGKVA